MASTGAQNIMKGLSGALRGIMNGILGAITGVLNGIESVFSNILNGVASTVSSIFSGIANTIGNIMGNAKNTVSNGLNAIANFFRGLHIEFRLITSQNDTAPKPKGGKIVKWRIKIELTLRKIIAYLVIRKR